MQFLSLSFLAFFPIVFALYYLAGKRYRYLVLLAANYVFYGWNNLAAVPTLILSTVLTYFGGTVLEKRKKRIYFALFFCANILVLLTYKYKNFLFRNINTLLGQEDLLPSVQFAVPVGLSFYIFQSTTYLNDVYRKGMEAERNFFRYAAFVSFFPSILSGPIQRSRDLLPQIKEPGDFSFDRARSGLLLLVWGLFQKIVVAGKLAAVVNTVYNDYLAYDNVFYLAAAVCFSLYIYCDFSSYSDMACGVAQILGFDIKKNFRNPYLAESLTDFWNRWHMSLNAWFVENIYIPLGGNRKGTARKWLNILVVFFVSGLWHGASWNYIVWGVLNGVLRIFGEVTVPLRKKLYGMFRINDKCGSVRWLKRAWVFFFITITWVFFRMPDFTSAVHVIRNMLMMYPTSLFNPELLTLFGETGDLLKLLLCTGVFVIIQYLRKEEGKLYRVFSNQPAVIQDLAVVAAVIVCVITLCSSTTTVNTQFIYFQF